MQLTFQLLDTVAAVNFSGSTGYGQDFVEKLIGQAGEIDIEDCMAALRHLIELGIAAEGSGKQFIIGGSYGGFIAVLGTCTDNVHD